MAWYNFKKEEPKQEILVVDSPLLSHFSTPFGKIGPGDLTTPYVRSYDGTERYVRFGIDNLYPQLINQMYFKSPLNGSIINYKVRATMGGGFELECLTKSGEQKVKEYTFLKKNKFNKLMNSLCKDLVMHGRICVLVDPTKTDVKITRVGPEKVRNNAAKNIYTISDDWSRSINMVEYLPYNPNLKEKSLFVYEIDGDAGQDIYPLPQYISILNWAFVSGEMAYLQKSNILNSIFPSFMIKLTKKFASDVELGQFKKTVDSMKGAADGGKIPVFVANTAAELPTLEAIPTNDNDKLFQQTSESINLDIPIAHSIDPILMGIRVSNKLGSGSDIKQSYVIFEKNVIIPLREMMTEVGDELLSIAGLNSTIKINNYQIVNEEIVDKTEDINGNTAVVAQVDDAEAQIRTAQATLRGSVGGVDSVLKIQESYVLGNTSYESAIAMLENIFGYSNEVSKKMLGNPKPAATVDPTKNNPIV